MRVIIMLLIMFFFFFTAIIMVGASVPDSGDTLGEMLMTGLRMILDALSSQE